MRRLLRYMAVVIITAIFAGACTQTDEEQKFNLPTLEELNGSYHSTFYLPALWELTSADGERANVKLEFMPLTHRLDSYNYDGELTSGKMHIIKFIIDLKSNEDLPNDKYLLRGYNIDGEQLKQEFVITVEERLVVDCKLVPDYSTLLSEEEGSSNEYIISDVSSFQDMCDLVEDDESKGRGKIFKQTRDIELPSNMGLVTEEGWHNVDFAGTYKGNGFTIEGFAFNGNRDSNANNVGLFRTLYNGAEIKNVKLNVGGINGANERCGILAGSVASGATVKVSSCALRGNINNSKWYIGGLIGYVEKDAYLEVKEIDLGMNILTMSDDNSSGNYEYGHYVGGIIGFCNLCKVTIDKVTVESDNINVQGSHHVGGLIGYVNNSELTIENVTLERTTTKDLEAIVAHGPAGGFIGSIEQQHRDITFSDSSVALPIKSDNDAGGAVGSYRSVDYSLNNCYLRFINTYVSANIVSKTNAGGFFGYVKLNRSSISDTTSLTTISFEGDCAFGMINSNKTAITAAESVGGICGYSSGGDYDFSKGKVTIAANITATEQYAGGMFGELRVSEIRTGGFTITDTSTISSNCAGGLVGYMQSAIIRGKNPWSFGQTACDNIPTFEDMLSGEIDVECKVEAPGTVSSDSYGIGGVIGAMDFDCELYDIATKSSVVGKDRVGGIVGTNLYLNCKVNGCCSSGSVVGTGIEIGGIVGSMKYDMHVGNCINYATVAGGAVGAETGAEIGGIAGFAKNVNVGNIDRMPQVEWSVNVGSVTGCNVVGGVIGLARCDLEYYHDTIMIIRCANYGKITAHSNSGYSGATSAVGGILGISDKPGMRITNCANHGDIEVKSSIYGVGGIAGKIGVDPAARWEEKNFHIRSCANLGNLSGDPTSCNWGGIVGYMEEGTTTSGCHSYVNDCYNKGDIKASVNDDRGIGGIAGYLDTHAELWRNVNFIMLSSYGGHNVGRIWGTSKNSTHTTEGNYYYDPSDSSGHALDDSEIGNKSVYSDLDFDGDDAMWVMNSGDAHPKIKDCPFQDTTYSENN